MRGYACAMTYPRSLLNDGEEIVVDRHPHWITLLNAAAIAVLAVILAIVLSVIEPFLGLVGLLCVVLAAIGCVGQFLRWRCTNFVVTTDRLIVRSGIIAKTGLEIPLDRVTNIAYHQSILERIVSSGDIVVESAGEQGHQRFSDVAEPMQLQSVIYRQAELASSRHNGNSNNAGTGTHAFGTGVTIPDQIEKLDELRQRGLISPAEFEAKKHELLSRM